MKELMLVICILATVSWMVVACGDDGDYWESYNREKIAWCRGQGGNPVMNHNDVYKECILP